MNGKCRDTASTNTIMFIESGWEFGFSLAFLVHVHRPICGFSGCSFSSRLSSFLSLILTAANFFSSFPSSSHLSNRCNHTLWDMCHVAATSAIRGHIIQYSYSHSSSAHWRSAFTISEITCATTFSRRIQLYL